MIFSSTKDDFRLKLEGIHAEQEANKLGDLDYESLKRKLERM